MRILVVSSYLPYPLYSGGHIRLYNLIKQLSTKHSITLVCEKRGYQTAKDIEEVKKYCEEVYTIDRKKQWSLENILKAGFSQIPFLIVGHTLPPMKQIIVSLLNTKRFDLIHIETFYVFQNVPQTYLPTVLVEHNIEYKVYERYSTKVPRYLRPLLKLDIAKIRREEKKAWKRATKLVAVSETEKQGMKNDDISVVPNGVDIEQYKWQNAKTKFTKKEKRILFIGDFKWIQNQKAVEFIITSIWPLILEKFGSEANNLKLWIVGKHIPEWLTLMGDNSIIFDEHAPDDTVKIYAKSILLLAPITVGGGTSYKILESMATGTPVVTTPLGVEGLGAQANKEALVGEKPEEIATHVITILQKFALYEKISKEARILIEQKYSWKIISQQLEKVYESTKQ